MQNHTQLPTGLSFSYETERLILRLPSTDYLREIHDFLCPFFIGELETTICSFPGTQRARGGGYKFNY